jgi:voltage-gated potassium channel Kch
MAQSETAKKIETPTADSSTLAAKIDAAKTDAVTPAVPAPPAAKVTAKVKRPSLRYRLYHFLFDVHGDHSIAQTFEQWLAILIIANMSVMLIELIPNFYEPYKKWFHIFDIISIGIFSAEYLLRFYVAPEDPEFSKSKYPRFKYIFSLYAIIDLAAVLPFYLTAFIHMDLRVLRVLRLLRLFKLFRVVIPAIHEFIELNQGRTFRQRVHAFVFPSEYGGKLHGYWDLFIVLWVSLSVLAVVLETVDSVYYNLAVEFMVLDSIAVLIFCFEFSMRLYSCVEEPQFKHWFGGRFRYLSQPTSIIDFLAIVPFFLEVLLHHLLDLRFLRTFRLLRLFKLMRYSGAASTLVNVMRRELPVIGAALFTMMLLVVLTASLGYLFEHEAQPDKFENIPTTIYWAVITLASVGYGDISPVTTMGRLMTVVMAILGLGIFAVPASILSSGYMQELASQRQELMNRLHDMLSDGVLSDEEKEELHELANQLSISSHQLDVLIETARQEYMDKASRDYFMPKEFLEQHPEIAVAQFHILSQQINRLASLSNQAVVTQLIAKSADITEIEKQIWQQFTSINVGPEVEPPKKGRGKKSAA